MAKRKVYKISLLIFSASLTACSHYLKPDPMRQENLENVLNSKKICRDIPHSRIASRFIFDAINSTIKNSPDYKQAHGQHTVSYHNEPQPSVVTQEVRCPLVTRFRFDHRPKKYTADIQYVLTKTVVQGKMGPRTVIAPSILFNKTFMHQYGYDRIVPQSDVKPPPSDPAHDYGRQLDLWIRGHMIYPEAAQKAGIHGYTTVTVLINRQGKVLSIRFVKSSGSVLLDNATMSMFIGKTLPGNPPLKGAVFHIDLTINYTLVGH
ncbi:energy transducer TonB [Komagataeibacter nataicola]|nr:TonB family protein [Komagataeibacter nataicola]PYD66592.1 hypothetical protein CDI09_07695 [Komagataeibacter nataicola]